MDQLIVKLKDLNIRLKLVGGKLKINAPKGVMTREIVDEIKANKEELIHMLNNFSKRGQFHKIPKAAPKDYYELSLAQKRMYFIYLLNPNVTAYNMPQFYKIKGNLDVPRLEAALQKLVARHASFRTVFSIVEDEPVQKVLPKIELKMDYRSCDETELAAIEDAFIYPFDLEKDCLLRVALLKIGHEEYRLLLDTHHIINDGESNNIILRDLIRLYDGDDLEEIKAQYIDYSEWQNSPAFKKRLQAQQEFWTLRFEDFPGLLDLTLDYKQIWENSPKKGEAMRATLNVADTQALKSIVEKEGTTMFIIVLSLINILFSKLTNQEDVTIGSPVAGRHHPDLKNIVGMFVNSLPLRNFPKGDLTFMAFLKQVTTSVIDSFDNQDFHYEQLSKELNLERVGDRNPLFNILYTYINEGPPVSEKKGLLEVMPYESVDIHAKFDFSITALEVEGKLYTNFQYMADLMGADLMERVIAYYQKIIQAVINDPMIKIAEIDILSEEEKKILLYEYNDTKVVYPEQQTILDLLEKQAQESPDNIALVVGEKQWTYQELHRETNQLAQHLCIKEGLGQGDYVGIYTTRSAAMIISTLAVLKAGGVYIPLDPKISINRINKIAEDSTFKLIVSDQCEDLEGLSEEVRQVDLVAANTEIEQAPAIAPEVPLQGKDAAYIIYTSGSTGVPKGVLIEHTSLLDYSLTFKNYFSIEAKDRVIQQSSLAFDTAVEEIFPALLSGASLTLIPQGGLDIDYILHCIKNQGATVLSTTPLVLNELNKYAPDLENLRLVISGGDLLLPAHISEILKTHTVYNTYGPSESTVCITYNKISRPENISYLGKAIANRQVFITNRHGGLCPILVPGELCVSGSGLARGYVNNEALTAEKFVENPFFPGERMYKTGDLARWLPDGNIEFFGRIDNQVKIRGIRIELGEIENLLVKHEMIQEVVVTVLEKEGDKYLVAYYVAEEELATKSLLDFLYESLPTYMVPSYYVHLDQLPLTSSGKPDTKKFPKPEIQAEEYEAPTTEIEERLVQIWAELLNLDPEVISVNRSFFELGGHSLKTISLISKMEKEFHVKIKLRTIFAKPTIRELGKNILMAFLAKNPKSSKHKVTI